MTRLICLIPLHQIHLDFHPYESTEGIGENFYPAEDLLGGLERDVTQLTGCLSHPLFSFHGLTALQWVRQMVKGVVERLLPPPCGPTRNAPKVRVPFTLPVLPGYQILEVPE
jgi:hypothetical protein